MTHKTVVISLGSPLNVTVITAEEAAPLCQCPRLCTTKHRKRTNFFQLLVILSIAGFAYIVLMATPYSFQYMNMLERASSSPPRTSWLPHSPGFNSSPLASLKSVRTNQPEVNGAHQPSTKLVTTTSVRVFSHQVSTISVQKHSGIAKKISMGVIPRLNTTTSLRNVSNLLATNEVSVTSSAPEKLIVESTISLATSDRLTDKNGESNHTIEGASRSRLSTATRSSNNITAFHTQTKTPEAPSLTTGQVSREDPPLYVTAYFRERLGNQMFIYASLLGIARAQNRTAIIKKGSKLEVLFQITHVNNNMDVNGWEFEDESMYATYVPKFMNLTHVNKIIWGYFQSWRYFQHNQDEVRREFKFKDEILRKAQEHLGKFRSESSDRTLVGVHVRRGDFLNKKNTRLGYGVPQASYFLNAFTKIRELFPDKNFTFLVASDDLKWCSRNLKYRDVRIMKEDSDVVHFAAMANCDHVVLSGGTYGWWAAWLSSGVKIYFSKYVAKGTRIHDGFTDEDYYPPDWIGLDN